MDQGRALADNHFEGWEGIKDLGVDQVRSKYDEL